MIALIRNVSLDFQRSEEVSALIMIKVSLDIQGSEGSECTHNVSLDIQRSEEVSALIMFD